jgi:hypothetical protein
VSLTSKVPVLAVSPQWLLAELKSAHDRFLSGLAELDRILEHPTSVLNSYLARRGELSAMTKTCSLSVQAARDHVLERANRLESDELARLFVARRRTLGLSAEHLSTWSGWAIAANWSRHRSAQRALRSHWIELIELEQTVLYPLLSKHV